MDMHGSTWIASGRGRPSGIYTIFKKSNYLTLRSYMRCSLERKHEFFLTLELSDIKKEIPTSSTGRYY